MSYIKGIIDLLKIKYEQTGLVGVNGFLKSNKLKHVVEVKEFEIIEFSAEQSNYPEHLQSYHKRDKWIEECPEDEFRCYYYHHIFRKGYAVYRAKGIKILE